MNAQLHVSIRYMKDGTNELIVLSVLKTVWYGMRG